MAAASSSSASSLEKPQDTEISEYLRHLKTIDLNKQSKIKYNKSNTYVEKDKFYNVYEKNKCGTYLVNSEDGNNYIKILSLKYNEDEKQCMMPFNELMGIVFINIDIFCHENGLDDIKVKITDASSHTIKTSKHPYQYEFRTIILKLTDNYSKIPSIYEKYGFVSEFNSLDEYQFLMSLVKSYCDEFKTQHGHNLYNISDGLQNLTKRNMRSYCEKTQALIDSKFEEFYQKYMIFIGVMYQKIMLDLYNKIIEIGLSKKILYQVADSASDEESTSKLDEESRTPKYGIYDDIEEKLLYDFYECFLDLFDDVIFKSDEEPVYEKKKEFVESFFAASIFAELEMTYEKKQRVEIPDEIPDGISDGMPDKKPDKIPPRKISEKKLLKNPDAKRVKIAKKSGDPFSAELQSDSDEGGFSNHVWFHHCY